MPRTRRPGGGSEVDSRNVWKTNAKTARSFQGRVVGSYQRTGPDSWDPFELVPREGPSVDINPGLEVQVEDSGARFRMRVQGVVRVVEWTPAEGEAEAAEAEASLRDRFLETCVRPFEHKEGMGAAAFIAKTLAEGSEPELD